MLAQLLIRLAAARGHLVLVGILLVAAGLRFWGLSFGLPHDHCRPDENLLVHHALSIGAGDLNPHAFYWPTLHFYLLALVFGVYFVAASAVDAFSGLQEFELYFHLDPSPFYLLGRSLSALFGTATVWLTYKIGRMLGDHRAGQISALFLAVCFLHVRDSHFLTTDVPATFYFVASCGMTLRYAKMGRTRDLYWGATLLGFAASTKYNWGSSPSPYCSPGSTDPVHSHRSPVACSPQSVLWPSPLSRSLLISFWTLPLFGVTLRVCAPWSTMAAE